MTKDYSKMSNEELFRIARIQPKNNQKDYSKMSNEELFRIARIEPQESMGRIAAQIPRNLAASTGDILDLPIMGVNYGLKKLGAESQVPYVGNKIAEGIDYITGGYTTPQTKRERLAEAGTRAIGSLASGYGAGMKLAGLGIKGLSKVGRGLAKINPLNKTGITATGAGGIGQQAYGEHTPDDIVGRLGVGLGTDIAVRTALGAVNKRNIANILKINPKSVESFKKIGSNPTLGQASDLPFIKGTEHILKNQPFTGSLRNSHDNQYKKMMDVLGPGTKDLAMTELEAGKSLKKSLENYGQRASDITENLKYKIFEKVEHSKNDLVDISQTLRNSKKFLDGLKTIKAKEEFLKSPVGKDYLSLIDRTSLVPIKGTLKDSGKVHLPDLMEFRTKLFDEISKGELGKVSRGRLENLRGNLNKDIKDYMKSIGAQKEWDKYNKFYKNYATYRKSHVLSAREIPELEAHKIFDSIGHNGKLDRSLLESIYASHKKSNQKEIMDALIQKMGKNGDHFDVHKFSSKFSGQPKETKQLLLSPLSNPMKEKFQSVIDSIGAIKESNKFSNPSRTAFTQATMEAGKIGVLSAGNFLIGNEPSDATWQYALLLAGSAALSKGMFANPKFINWAYNGSKMKPRRAETHIAGIKGILGRPVYQEIKNALHQKDYEKE